MENTIPNPHLPSPNFLFGQRVTQNPFMIPLLEWTLFVRCRVYKKEENYYTIIMFSNLLIGFEIFYFDDVLVTGICKAKIDVTFSK
ncbi:hypothetical protein RCL_jg24438.t1 [Rhizophagus clarus]|uniref:Uncharacterized protein n=1 Tax=Rhizophagus clarus TaxID=94130 RepID=A0A8H3MB38_9GLOM|nr:hypothetical protein RCL_jg24438.t1 [Rhizophagus clarus]